VVRVAVVSLKGGVGKTTTAVYLAAVAAGGRWAVTVVDADPQGSAAVRLEERPIDGVEVLEAPSERLLRKALGQNDDRAVVIVDTPPASERLTSAALAVADGHRRSHAYRWGRGGPPHHHLGDGAGRYPGWSGRELGQVLDPGLQGDPRRVGRPITGVGCGPRTSWDSGGPRSPPPP
jgi:CobQ/CobB/MinD/ParA nucleotide binding domain